MGLNKRSFIGGVIAIAAIVVASGSSALAASSSADSFFRAEFLSVYPNIQPSPLPPQPAPQLGQGPVGPPIAQIKGMGYVQSGVIDPPGPNQFLPVIESQLLLDFSVAIDGLNCREKAVIAAAAHRSLRVEGEGQVTRWSAQVGSGGGGTALTSAPIAIQNGALIQASKFISCELGPSLPKPTPSPIPSATPLAQ